MVTALIAFGADVGRRCLPRPISVRLGLLGYVLSLPYLLYRRIRDGPREHPNDAEAQNDFEMKEKSLENENAELRNRLESTQKEGDILRNEEQYLKSEIQNLKTKLQASEEQKEDALRRLSELISVKLRDNNPNIADLNDPYRPTKLAEISSELYDNEWTEAFDVLEKSYSEEESIAILLDIVMDTFHFCKRTTDDVWEIVVKWHVQDAKEDQDKLHWLKENRKYKAESLLPEMEKECLNFLASYTDDIKLKELMSSDSNVKAYLRTCVRLCVYMCVQDPPCVMECPGWRSCRPRMQDTKVESNQEPNVEKQIKHDLEDDKDALVADAEAGKEKDGDSGNGKLQNRNGASKENMKGNKMETAEIDNAASDDSGELAGKPNGKDEEKSVENGNSNTPRSKDVLDKNLFREYTKSGKFISFIVWPILYLHEGGPVLCKGVAQGCKNK